MTTPEDTSQLGPQRCEVGGIPCWWEDARGPTMHAALVFRVGVADETAATRGITHLVEHLAMPVGVFRHMAVDSNAFVDMKRTTFYADGEARDVTTFLTGVIERLANLPVDTRLDVERQLLLAEADTRDAAAVDTLAATRYGLQGYGLAGVAEHGLHRLGPDDARAWAAERFGRRNAVILCTGPPPDLSVLLPEGRRWPMPIWPERGPSRTKIAGPANGATVTFSGPPTPAFQVARRILADRAERVLRHERGLSYTAGGDSTRHGDTIHATINGACLERDGAALLGELLSIIDDVAENGPTAAELDADRATNARDVTSRDPTPRVMYAALSELYGVEPVVLAELVAREARVPAEDVAAAVAAARETLVIAAGEDVPLPAGFEADPPPVSFSHDGLRYRERRMIRPGRVILGDDAVTMSVGGDDVTLRRDDIVLLLRYEDGGRVLIDVGGVWMQMVPHGWRRGDDLARRLDAFVPSELHVPIPEKLLDDD